MATMQIESVAVSVRLVLELASAEELDAGMARVVVHRRAR